MKKIKSIFVISVLLFVAINIYAQEKKSIVVYKGSNVLFRNDINVSDTIKFSLQNELRIFNYIQNGNIEAINVSEIDSIKFIVHNCNAAVENEISVSACVLYVWNETTYIETENYIQNFIAANGCDSVVTLHLTINQPFANEINATACVSHIWNGVTYTQTGDYIQNFIAANGCDSVVTLHLTMSNQPIENEINVSTSGSYTWNGITYTEGGDYIQTFTATNGCDSIVTLHLRIVVGVEINGVIWATSNVDMPGTFAANPHDAGMFYQWNRNIGWSSTSPMVNSNGGTVWDFSDPPWGFWTDVNDPCPAGWRVPMESELQSLVNASNVWTTVPVNGRIFGTAPNTIFLPAAGNRRYADGSEVNWGSTGYYWGNKFTTTNGRHLIFTSTGQASTYLLQTTFGFSVRCVAE